jgi:DinB superfamily
MTPPDREEALATLRDGDDRLAALFAGLDEEAMVRRRTIGSGEWSAKDLMGHMALWEELALATIETWLRGEQARLEGGPFDGEADALNAWNEERKRGWPLERVRTEAAETHRQLLDAIDTLDRDRWKAPRTFEDHRAQDDLGSELGGILGAADGPFRHAFAHLPDLQAYVASLGG